MSKSIYDAKHEGIMPDNITNADLATPTPGTAGVVQRIEKLRKPQEDLNVIKLKEAHPCQIPQY
jgi:hypothetical protein